MRPIFHNISFTMLYLETEIFKFWEKSCIYIPIDRAWKSKQLLWRRHMVNYYGMCSAVFWMDRLTKMTKIHNVPQIKRIRSTTQVVFEWYDIKMDINWLEIDWRVIFESISTKYSKWLIFQSLYILESTFHGYIHPF